ncbi:major facilitator superfamily transporter [Xylariomycetidae sp. FL0641]|nr:major facilitator superfamily transporter [Xylariomycetidae sp. FL0641]
MGSPMNFNQRDDGEGHRTPPKLQKAGFDEADWRYPDGLPKEDLEITESPSAPGTDGYRDVSTSSSELEKSSHVHPRAHIFLGKPMSVLHELAFYAVVSTANFTPHSGFHQTLCILHMIGDDLGVTAPGQLVWLMAGFGLSVGTLILFAGRLGDVFGYKRLFLIGNVWFAIASLLAGLAIFVPMPPAPGGQHNGEGMTGGLTNRYALFLAARIAQGMGPALLIPNGVALLGATYVPGPRKAMLFAIFGAMAPASAILSPAVTSLLAEFAWWPCAFWAFALVLLLVTVAGVYAIPDDDRVVSGPDRAVSSSTSTTTASSSSSAEDCRPPGLWARLRTLCVDLDVLGAVTGVSGLVLISIALNQGALAGWRTPYVPALLACGVLLCIAFVQVERRAPRPLIPVSAVANSGVALVLAAVFCGWGCFAVYIYYVWSFYEVLRGAGPLLATAWHAPVLVSGVAAALTTGLVIHRVGPAAVMAAALAAFAAGTALIATAPIGQTYWAQTFLCNVVVTWGMDLSFPAATLMLSDLVPPRHQGIAASLVTTVVNYSGALALGVAGSVELAVNRGGKTPEDTLRGYRGAWYIGIGLAVVGFAASCVFARRFAKKRDAAM